MHPSLYGAEQQRSGSYSHWYKSEENSLKLNECNRVIEGDGYRHGLVETIYLKLLFGVQWQPGRPLADRRIHNHTECITTGVGFVSYPKLGISPEPTFLRTQKSCELQFLLSSSTWRSGNWCEWSKYGKSISSFNQETFISIGRPMSWLLSTICPEQESHGAGEHWFNGNVPQLREG